VTFVAPVLAAAAVLLWAPPVTAIARTRLRRLRAQREPAPSAWRGSRVPDSRMAAAMLGGFGVAVLVGGVVGVPLGVAATWALHRWLGRLEPRAERVRRARMEADVPVAADLLAACLLAGCPPVDAVDAVADALDGPLSGQLRRVVATLRLGGDPVSSWLMLGQEPALAPLGWSLARASDGGGALAAAVARVADEQRLTRRWAAEAAARRVGVQAAAPLGLCFLPAFVLLGIVPVIAGMSFGVTS
jgi:Flp pilus assembly protein TadB